MYLIFPAEDLVLMTYNVAIPLISPRPTLDCLRKPQVPIYIPTRSRPHLSDDNKLKEKCPKPLIVKEDSFNVKDDLPLPLIHLSFDNQTLPLPQPDIIEETFIPQLPITFVNVAPPPKIIEPPFVNTGQNQLNCSIPMAEFKPSSLPSRFEDDTSRNKISLTKTDNRKKCDLVLLEPDTCDPTKPRLGPGWGRPMSPMSPKEFPIEVVTKTPTSKSRLKPKLHIPLAKLGKSSSVETKESTRIREDLHLHVENPVFNTENLRQRNFDAFFDSGEPVYKLQPKSPSSAPTYGNMDVYEYGSSQTIKSPMSQKNDRCFYKFS